MKTYLKTWLTLPILCLVFSETCFAQDGAKTQRLTTTSLALQNQLSIAFDPKFKLLSGNPVTREKILAFASRRNLKTYFDDTFIFFGERSLTDNNFEDPAAPVYNPYAGPRRNAYPATDRPVFDYDQASRLVSQKLSKGRQTLNFLLGAAASVYVSSQQNGR